MWRLSLHLRRRMVSVNTAVFSCLYWLGVVPWEAVVEEVVQDCHASLLSKPVLLQDPVRLSSPTGASAGPAVKLPAIEDVCLSHRAEGGGPEPAVDVVWLEPRLVTPVHLLVTQPAAGPHLPHAAPGHVLTDEVLLLRALQGDQVHAPFPISGQRHISLSGAKECCDRTRNQTVIRLTCSSSWQWTSSNGHFWEWPHRCPRRTSRTYRLVPSCVPPEQGMSLLGRGQDGWGATEGWTWRMTKLENWDKLFK